MAAAGLSEREQAGCRQLLELLGTEELLALTDTITNRLVHPESRQGATAPPRAGGGGGGGGSWVAAVGGPQPSALSPQPPAPLRPAASGPAPPGLGAPRSLVFRCRS